MSQIILQGYSGPLVITQGYSFAAISIWLSPFGPTVQINSVTHFITNIPANWSVTGGSLVVAGDGLSADFTAPGSPTTVTITVTDQTDAGNTLSGPIHVTTFGPVQGGQVVGEGVPPPPQARSIIQ